ncbi:MAG: SPASM domain-containing protein, partial [Candidatus Omnitrophica bacterium]|nr:SPASM domain-containing protein [Candidatus Omnitrophota bacterium]
GLDSIKFSVNGGTAEPYRKVHGVDAFTKVIGNIKWFSRYRAQKGLQFKIYVSMVPTSITPGEFQILKDILSGYVDEVDCRSCSNQGGNMLDNNNTENIDKDNLLGSMRKDQCLGKCPDLFFRCTVTPQGYLSACVVDYRNYLVVADLRKTYIKDAWHNETYVNLRKRHNAGDIGGLICHNCINNCVEETKPLLPEFAQPT